MAGPTLGELENESVSDTLRAVMAEKLAEAEPADTATEIATPPAEPALEHGKDARQESAPATEPVQDKAGRLHGEKGRFVPKWKDGLTEEPVAKEAKATPVEGEEPVEPVIAEPDEATEPPVEWTAAEQDQFRALPVEARKMVLARTTEAREATERATETTQRFAGIEQLLAPRRNGFARDGMDDVGAVRQLFALSDFAAQNPTGFVQWFTQARGIQPEQVFQFQQNPQTPENYTDPTVAPIVQRLDSVERFLQQQEQRFQADQQRAEQAQQQTVQTELQTFAAAKDDKGRLTRPHFNEVRSMMGSFVGSGQASDLQTAYDMACRAHPGVFAKIESARNAAAAQERAKQDREKAAAAKKAGSSVTGTPGDRAKPEPPSDIREDLRQQMIERGLMS